MGCDALCCSRSLSLRVPFRPQPSRAGRTLYTAGGPSCARASSAAFRDLVYSRRVDSPAWLRRAAETRGPLPERSDLHQGPVRAGSVGGGAPPRSRNAGRGHRTSPEQMVAHLAADTGYATPKVDVRAAVFRDNQILLVQERSDGGWTLPGGWCDVGEAPGVAAAREVEEESGYRVRTAKLLAVYDKLRHEHPPESLHAYKLFFRCDLVGGYCPRERRDHRGGFLRRERASAAVAAAGHGGADPAHVRAREGSFPPGRTTTDRAGPLRDASELVPRPGAGRESERSADARAALGCSWMGWSAADVLAGSSKRVGR